MSLFRVLLSIIFPPLAVVDKGCGSVLIVLLLTIAGWIPGVIGALVILNKDTNVPRSSYPTYPTNNNRTRCQYWLELSWGNKYHTHHMPRCPMEIGRRGLLLYIPQVLSQSSRKVHNLLKKINGAKKSADILPVRQVAVTLHKNWI